MTKSWHDVNAVIAALKRHWNDGLTQPELGRQIQAEFPGIPLAIYNAASDIAWEQANGQPPAEAEVQW